MLKKTEEAASVSRGSIVAGNIPKNTVTLSTTRPTFQSTGKLAAHKHRTQATGHV